MQLSLSIFLDTVLEVKRRGKDRGICKQLPPDGQRPSDNETKQKDEDQPRHRQQCLHQGPGFEGVGEVQLEVFFYQPEACVVYVR
jgi:hypothetical protein